MSQSQTSDSGEIGAKGRKRTKSTFRPPLKSLRKELNDVDSPNRLSGQQGVEGRGSEERDCHTVLSYCNEEEEGESQVLSMFSGERRKKKYTETDSQDMDELIINPFASLTDTQSSHNTKLNDTLSILGNPNSILDDQFLNLDDPLCMSTIIDKEHLEQDDPILKLDSSLESMNDEESLEQLVPSSSPPAMKNTPSRHQEQEGEETEEGEEEDEMVETHEQVPIRRYRGARSSTNRHYDLQILPPQFRKTVTTSNTTSSRRMAGKMRSKVNWAKRVSVLGGGFIGGKGFGGGGGVRRRVGGGGGGEGLRVYEVPLSTEETASCDGGQGEEEHDVVVPQARRGNVMDLSHSNRTREEQLAIDTKVLAAISRTRKEIRALKDKHNLMMSSLDEMTSLYDPLPSLFSGGESGHLKRTYKP